MPNIEIHGFPEREGKDLRRVIFDLFKDKPYVNEMVVTLYKNNVSDVNGFNQPFIRVVNSCQEHTQEILEALGTLDMDIEHLQLKAFIPKKLPEVGS